MRLKALKYCDEFGVSFKPGDVKEVSRDIGKALTDKHPNWFELQAEEKQEKAPAENKAYAPTATKGKKGK